MLKLKVFKTLGPYVLAIAILLLCSQIVHGGSAPNFTLTDIDGKTFSLSDFRGKVVILNFFSSRCGPCNTEMSHLKAVQKEFGGRLVIISLSVRLSYDTDEILRQFRADHGITWIIARDTANVREKYAVSTIPTLSIIDQKGDMRYRHAGLTEASTIIEEVNELLTITVSLTVTTSPSLQDVHFRVDGDDYYTSAGRFSVELEVGQHQVELVDTVVRQGKDTEYRFSRWSGIASGSSNPKQVDVTTSSALKAVFDKYYTMVFAQSGGEGTPHVTVDGTSYKTPKTFWFAGGSSHSFSYETPVSGGTGIRYVLTSTSHTSPIKATSPTTVTGNYAAQYYVTVTSAHDAPTPSRWVDKGGSLTARVTSLAGDDGAGTRYRCTAHKIDDGHLQSGTNCTLTNIQAPHKIEFQWIRQYCLTVDTIPRGLASQPTVSPTGSWHDAGSLVTCTAQVVNGYHFDHWILDGAPQEDGNMALTVTMELAHNAIAHYTAPADFNSDGRINEADISLIVGAFQSEIDETDYDARMDLDNSGVIDIIDVAMVAKDFEKTT